jgi:hypothetical protein
MLYLQNNHIAPAFATSAKGDMGKSPAPTGMPGRGAFVNVFEGQGP